jgi:glycosyltransferase involved in cell wall biosynthesis
MAKRDLYNKDASHYASSELEYVIKSSKKAFEAQVPTVSPQQAMSDNRVFKSSSNRNVTRVLFISQNTELLNPLQQTLDGYVNISDLFDEVHVLILRQGISPKNPVLRVADNVWLYTAAAEFWWMTPEAGMKMVEEQLKFASGFRPDLIVARDPFESAWLAYKIGKKYGRATQLHVLDDYTTNWFIKSDQHNYWRRFIPRFTVPHFASVRTATSTIQNVLQKKFVISDIDVLPKYQNYEELIDIEPSIDLKEKYKPFVFIILYVGRLGHESTLYRAIDAARFVLQNPRVGMIVLGDGEARGEFEKRTKLLGIERQVVFETKVFDIVPYLKSANLMIVTDTDTDSEEFVLKGAAAGIPMVMSRTEKREDIFSHGESAFLCDVTDGQALTDKIDDLLNDVGLRRQFVLNGQDLIRSKFHSDPNEYKEAYRTSIEQAFFVETDDADESEEDN